MNKENFEIFKEMVMGNDFDMWESEYDPNVLECNGETVATYDPQTETLTFSHEQVERMMKKGIS